MLLRTALVSLLLGASAALPAAACTLTLTTGGTLALSADATRMDSTVTGGAGAVITILNVDITPATISVAAPVLQAYPGGFDPGSATLQVAYAGGGLLSSVTKAFTSSPSNFQVPALLGVATILTVQNRIQTTAGFSTGTYQTSTVITCS